MVNNVDFSQLANYTLPRLEKVDGKARYMKIDPELKAQIRKYLGQQGYEVTEGAKLPGKSGIEHTFDMLAQRNDGFTSYNIAIGIAAGGDRDIEVGTIFSFANKAYDCGLLPSLNLVRRRNSWLASSE